MNTLIFTILIGIGATAVMDVWALLRKQLFNIAPTNWGAVGRWIAYMRKGTFRHVSIADSRPIAGEQLIGWAAHYLIGIGYAGLLVATFGSSWINNPSIGPALVVGVVTVLAPFFILQPGMGAGVLARRTANPNSVRLHSLINHGVFGLGLYISALALAFISSI
ncbi:MAG: DUF2938 domain-containing protein [Paraglaciecola sp.]|uniref:DUF2938 domain-containing protein n=1 Tax=Paraglaciecola sp. TaxID=1920173 RepID=UPI003298A30E